MSPLRARRAATHLAVVVLVLAACTKFTPKVQDTNDTVDRTPCANDRDCQYAVVPECAPDDPNQCDCKHRVCDTLAGWCTFPVKSDSCFVLDPQTKKGRCYGRLSTPSEDRCLVCMPDKSQGELQPKACASGATCDPASGQCVGGADILESDVCVGDACQDDVCGGLGCCVDSTSCPEVPGACSKATCQDGVCRESTQQGDCVRTLNTISCCASCAVPSEAEPVVWAVEQPEDEPLGWRFEAEPVPKARFGQNKPNSQKKAWLIGPIFSVSRACADSKLRIQIEHEGEISGGVPHVVVRGLDTLEWRDLGNLPPPSPERPCESGNPIITDFALEDPPSDRVQIALRATLSGITPTGEVAVRRVCLIAGEGPEWVDAPNVLLGQTGAPASWSARAEDPDGDEVSYNVVSKPEFVEVNDGLDEQDRPVVLISANPGVAHVGEHCVVLDARDCGPSGGRITRLHIPLSVSPVGECGDDRLDAGEECDLGPTPPAKLCSDQCAAPELVVPTLIAGDQSKPSIAAFPGEDSRMALVWPSGGTAQDRDVYLRLSDTHPGPGADVFPKAEVRVNHGAAGDQIEPAVAVLSAASIVVLWQSDVSDPGTGMTVSHVELRLFNGNGEDPSPPDGNGRPYPAGDQDVGRLDPSVDRFDDTHFVAAWIEREAIAGGSSTRRVIGNVVSLSQIATPPDPFEVVGGADVTRSTPIVIRRAEDLLFVWHELDTSGITSIQYALWRSDGSGAVLPPRPADDASSGAAGLPSAQLLDDGTFLIAWEATIANGTGRNIRVRRFDSAGAAMGASALVNETLSGTQGSPEMGVNGLGEVMVAWHGQANGTGDFDIISRLITSPRSLEAPDLVTHARSEKDVNLPSSSDQTRPAVVGLHDGRFGVIWQSDGQDGSGAGVFLRVARLEGL